MRTPNDRPKPAALGAVGCAVAVQVARRRGRSHVRPYLRMRVLTVWLFVAATAFLSGCATHHSDPLERRAQISYYDRNGDGKVDLEKHQYPGVADADWELRDDDYDGRYEKKILYGFAVTETAVDIQVPTGVKIETKQ